jgi:hypothetical protein
MTIEVAHRQDSLLQKNVERGCPQGLEHTFIGVVTVPTHAALLAFLDERVVGQQFADLVALNGVLSQWPDFAEEKGLNLELFHDFDTITVNREEGYIYCGTSPGGDFVIGHIQET